MQNCYPPVIEKSFEIIKRFEEKFGWFKRTMLHWQCQKPTRPNWCRDRRLTGSRADPRPWNWQTTF